MDESWGLADWLTSYGPGAIDPAILAQFGLGDPNAFLMSGNIDSMEYSPATQEILRGLEGYKVRSTNKSGLNTGYDILDPSGNVVGQDTIEGDADSWFDKFMYSGAPIAMMAGGPLAGMFGGTTAGALIGGGLGALNSNSDLDATLKGAAMGGLGGALAEYAVPAALRQPITAAVGNALGGSAAPALGTAAAGGGLASLVGGGLGSMIGGDTGMASETTSGGDLGGSVGNIIDQLTSFFPSGNNFMSALPGLMGMFANYEGQKQTGDMLESLTGMYGQDSPYAQTMRSNLERRDAAAGRRSQYGAREVELQAKLADVASKRIADIQGLNRDQLLMRNLMMQQGMSGLNSLFGRNASGQPRQQTGGGTLGSAVGSLINGVGNSVGGLGSLFPALGQSWESMTKNIPNTESNNAFTIPGMFGNSPLTPDMGYQFPVSDFSGMSNNFDSSYSWPDLSVEDGFNFDFPTWGD